ncbi:hypothetical protein SNE40_017520 [Patella caerulea]|uniref:Uncharacterized protein n=1 Tax=Patella caerulea TaxID=87958 RepID=A0AAN8JF73_PATCE
MVDDNTIPIYSVDSASKSTNKHRLVHNYLWNDPFLQAYDSDDVISFTESGIMVCKRLDKDYYKLTVEQWGYGNARILQELIETKAIDETGILDYLEYTKTVNRLFSCYVKGSVLLLDREYRELQHKEQFRWGIPKTNIQDFQLIPKQNNPSVQVLYGGGPTQKPFGVKSQTRRKGSFTGDGREICRKFNTDSFDLPYCKLAHVCTLCFSKDYSVLSHPKNTSRALCQRRVTCPYHTWLPQLFSL